jgi:hypothetical protein
MKELRVIDFLELLANDKIKKPKMIIFDENIYQLGGYDKMGSGEIIIGNEKRVYDYDYITTEDARYGNDWLSNNLFFIEEYIPSNKAIVFNLKINSHHPSIDWN